MSDLETLQMLASMYGKGCDYVMFREGGIVYVFNMSKAVGVPAIIMGDDLEKVVSQLLSFGNEVRVVFSVDGDGGYVLPFEEGCDEDY